jgi:hypothetical protein
MAEPNSPQNDSGQKPKKDFWDKADIVIKGVIGGFTVIAAVLVAVLGGNIQQAITNQTGKLQESIATQSTGKDYLSIALGILEQKDLPEDLKKNKGLRKWAVNLLQHYSQEKLDNDTANELIDGETNLPKTSIKDLGPVNATVQSSAKANPSLNLSIGRSNDNSVEASMGSFGLVFISRIDGRILDVLHPEISFINSAVFSPDNRYVVIHNEAQFVIYGLPSLGVEPVPVKPGGGIRSIAFPSNDAFVVTDLNGKQTKYGLTGKEIP